MTTTLRYLSPQSNRTTLFFRHKVFIVFLALICLLETCSAGTSDSALTEDCGFTPATDGVNGEIGNLMDEVSRMTGHVIDLQRPGNTADYYKMAAIRGICSENKQNASRKILSDKGKAQKDLDAINKLIDQIIKLLRDFIKLPTAKQTPEKSEALAAKITKIRGKAKPRKSLLFIYILLSPKLVYLTDLVIILSPLWSSLNNKDNVNIVQAAKKAKNSRLRHRRGEPLM
ncbi:uncharacterized protein MELLADRAFT_64926 [Melampsora larici-populina 98AG31]|uniref:Secreted protein n=1 Tax=Melampsora larici-populina (strain 98AG31 / pathotype 3-4-7) TaxID=747676 RepID=F4RTA9_MELLP|nr:uncharacterized protein MELLADRAFT_64926 [Melampsora larici-populina 98AG31]EGG04231.1 hypothetical protein MELLADRAFT_64926 [Melampsora larici-populina 98AG31]